MLDINQICDYIIFRLKSEDEGQLSHLKLQKVNQYSKLLYRFLVLKYGLLFILDTPLKVILEAVLKLLGRMLIVIY